MFVLAKRFVLFLLVNFLIVLTISLVWGVLTSVFHLPVGGYAGLLAYCIIFGFGGALASLALSRASAKWAMGVQVVDENSPLSEVREVVNIVHNLARRAGLPALPEVGIYESDEINAFATGPSKSRALVAVSSGLLRRMSHDQVEGVLGHEIGHIANGDMVTMTLIQAVINSVVLFLARLLASVVASAVEERQRYLVEGGLIVFLQVALSLFGSLVVNYFSRRREYRADAWGAKLAGRPKMIGALRALAGTAELADTAHPALATLKISGNSGIAQLFATHPPLAARIAALERAGSTGLV